MNHRSHLPHPLANPCRECTVQNLESWKPAYSTTERIKGPVLIQCSKKCYKILIFTRTSRSSDLAVCALFTFIEFKASPPNPRPNPYGGSKKPPQLAMLCIFSGDSTPVDDKAMYTGCPKRPLYPIPNEARSIF